MNFQALQRLPEEVKDVIFSETSVAINSAIATEFQLSNQQLSLVLGILADVYTGSIAAVDMPEALSKISMPTIDVRALALTLAQRRLWPLHHYVRGVDTLIQRLGGVVPAETPESEHIAHVQDDRRLMTAQEFLDQSADRRYLLLTHQPFTDSSGQNVEPTIENWLKDFLRLMGPVMKDGLARSQYLVRSSNAMKLSQEDKANLLNFLVTYGENTGAFWRIDDRSVTVQALTGEPLPDRPKQPSQAVGDVHEAVEKYTSYIQTIESIVARKTGGIEIEVAGQSGRLSDVLWNALGVEDKERVITVLILLAQKKLLIEILRQDLRFIGILRRSISVRFGDQAKSKWQPDGSLASVSLFIQLVLQEKLGYSVAETAMIGHYISRLAGLDSVSYIDMTRGEFRLREVQYSGTNLVIEGK